MWGNVVFDRRRVRASVRFQHRIWGVTPSRWDPQTVSVCLHVCLWILIDTSCLLWWSSAGLLSGSLRPGRSGQTDTSSHGRQQCFRLTGVWQKSTCVSQDVQTSHYCTWFCDLWVSVFTFAEFPKLSQTSKRKDDLDSQPQRSDGNLTCKGERGWVCSCEHKLVCFILKFASCASGSAEVTKTPGALSFSFNTLVLVYLSL